MESGTNVLNFEVFRGSPQFRLGLGLVPEPHLRTSGQCSWFCIWRSFPLGLENLSGCWGWNSGGLCARQVPYRLHYYHSSSAVFCFYFSFWFGAPGGVLCKCSSALAKSSGDFTQLQGSLRNRGKECLPLNPARIPSSPMPRGERLSRTSSPRSREWAGQLLGWGRGGGGRMGLTSPYHFVPEKGPTFSPPLCTFPAGAGTISSPQALEIWENCGGCRSANQKLVRA